MTGRLFVRHNRSHRAASLELTSRVARQLQSIAVSRGHWVQPSGLRANLKECARVAGPLQWLGLA